jgi:uncharacterized Zn-finger protein
LKTHSGEKSNKCNQCDYASSQAGVLRRHLKTHSGEKPNKCNKEADKEVNKEVDEYEAYAVNKVDKEVNKVRLMRSTMS